MDEYLMLSVLSAPGESKETFSRRLSTFWTQILRQYPEDFEKVFAETTSFELHGNQLERQYLIEPDVLDLLEKELSTAGIGLKPVDPDEIFSRYEAVSPQWMQIEH